MVLMLGAPVAFLITKQLTAPKASDAPRSPAERTPKSNLRKLPTSKESAITPEPAPTTREGPPPTEIVRPLPLFSVISSPSGAIVEVDGGFVGTTPLVLRHAIEERPYRVVVRKEGYEAWEEEVRPARPSGAISLTVRLVPER
ncbi:MAG: PEGA domain-containing protein [Myxococcales bacterium]|nr:PEGA domain-containing protein [Myxococcales bacterium]